MFRRKSVGKRCSTALGGGPGCGVLFQETKNQCIALFFRDFDQQAKENIQEMKKELDSLLQTAEKAFTVELLKMPIAIRKMKRKDLLSTPAKVEPATSHCNDVSWSWFPDRHYMVFGVGLREGEEVALAATVTDYSLEDIANPKLVRTNSKKVKVTTIVEYKDAKHISAKKISKKISRTKLLASLSPGLNGKLNPLSRSLHSSASVTEAVKSPASDCSTTNFKATPKVYLKGEGENVKKPVRRKSW
ncbi:borealin-2-like [Lathamus discolor]|uniref:borealin-2-like n=1 Tax=Lathamus discolor TaxID=678569 RepID=UPI0032B80040